MHLSVCSFASTKFTYTEIYNEGLVTTKYIITNMEQLVFLHMCLTYLYDRTTRHEGRLRADGRQ